MIKFYWMVNATYVSDPFDTIDEAKEALAAKESSFLIDVRDKELVVSKHQVHIAAEEDLEALKPHIDLSFNKET